MFFVVISFVEINKCFSFAYSYSNNVTFELLPILIVLAQLDLIGLTSELVHLNYVVKGSCVQAIILRMLTGDKSH